MRSLKSISSVTPPRIAIQTIMVRGGTLNSLPLFKFLPGSPDLLSFAILALVVASLAHPPASRNSAS